MTEKDALAEEQKTLLIERIKEIDKKLMQVYSRLQKLEKLRNEKIDELQPLLQVEKDLKPKKYHIKRIR